MIEEARCKKWVSILRHHLYKVAGEFIKFLSKEDEWEIIAECIVIMIRNIERGKYEFQSDAAEVMYLKGILKNVYRKYTTNKQNEREKVFSLDNPLKGTKNTDLTYSEIIPIFDNAKTEVEVLSVFNALKRELSELPEKQRLSFLYCTVMSISPQSVAALLGVSERTVSTYVSLVAKKLKQRLAAYTVVPEAVRGVLNILHQVLLDFISAEKDKQVQALLYSFFQENLTLEELAARFGLPVEYVGKQISEFLNKVRTRVMSRAEVSIKARSYRAGLLELFVQQLRGYYGGLIITLGKFLQDFIRSHKLDYDTVAEALGLNPPELHNLLTDRLDADESLLRLIAGITGTPLAMLTQYRENSREKQREEAIVVNVRSDEEDRFFEEVMKIVRKRLNS